MLPYKFWCSYCRKEDVKSDEGNCHAQQCSKDQIGSMKQQCWYVEETRVRAVVKRGIQRINYGSASYVNYRQCSSINIQISKTKYF